MRTNVYAQFSRHHVNHTGTVATCGNSSCEVNTKVLSQIESMLHSSWPRAWLDSARAVVCCLFSSCFRWFLVSFVEEGSSTAPPDIFRSVRVTTSHFYAFLAKIVLPCSPRVLGGRLLVARILIVCVGMAIFTMFIMFITIMATVIVMTFLAVILRTSYCNVFLLPFCDERIDRPDTRKIFYCKILHTQNYTELYIIIYT